MMKKLSRLILIALLLAFGAASQAVPQAIPQEVQEAQDAYKNGNYALALKKFRPLAMKGDAQAQSGIAQMYFDGKGVRHDYRVAVLWFRKAAEQGNVLAQYKLALMYREGK